MRLLARISAHTQQICGLAWAPTGRHFVSGGNDNSARLFSVAKVVSRGAHDSVVDEDDPFGPAASLSVSPSTRTERAIPGIGGTLSIPFGSETHRFTHFAAVKALAFCPWRTGLLATGGGSNDRCIHFWHVKTGASLATIAVAAQVTSLIWSPLRREIAATFGYAQPEHPVRIAVFSWPDCRQRVAIPWPTEARALYAVPYPRGPSGARAPGEGDAWSPERSRSEGCIVVVGSDQSVRFHEVWSDARKVGGGAGPLGGSKILEEMEGIERDGGIIR